MIGTCVVSIIPNLDSSYITHFIALLSDFHGQSPSGSWALKWMRVNAREFHSRLRMLQKIMFTATTKLNILMIPVQCNYNEDSEVDETRKKKLLKCICYLFMLVCNVDLFLSCGWFQGRLHWQYNEADLGSSNFPISTDWNCHNFNCTRFSHSDSLCSKKKTHWLMVLF